MITAFIVFSMMPYRSIAQDITVTVFDNKTSEPLANTSILLNGLTLLITGADGSVVLNSPGADDTLIVTHLGYFDQIITFRALKGEGFRIRMEPFPYDLSEVVVSASKFDEKVREVPVQVRRMSRKEIEELDPLTSADMLQATGEVSVQRSQAGGGSPVIRGFEANKVLLVVDGVRLNNAIYRGGHLQNVITIDPQIVDRTEVIFGPGSVMYGSDALGGVMHFISRTPALSDADSSWRSSGNLALRFATANESSTGHFDFTIRKQNLGSVTSVTFSDIGDLRSGKVRVNGPDGWGERLFYQQYLNGRDTTIRNSDVSLQRPSGYSQLDLLQKLIFKSSDNTDHILNLQYSRSGDVPRYDRLTDTLDDGTFNYGEWFYGPQIRFLGSYKMRSEVVSELADQIEITAAYQFIEESRNTRGYGDQELTSRTEKLNIVSINTDIIKDISESSLGYGAEFIFNKVSSDAVAKNKLTGQESEAGTRYPDGGSDYLSTALYVMHRRPFNKLITEQGLRLNYTGLDATIKDTTFYKFKTGRISQDNLALSGVLGFVYLPDDHIKLNLTGSTGFRAPNVDDLAKVFDSTPGNVIVPNPELEPEYTFNGELGITIFSEKKFHVQIYGWHTWYRNATVTAPYTVNGEDSIVYDGVLSAVYANTNQGKAVLYGFSFSSSVYFSQRFKVELLLSKTKGTITSASEDVPLDHIPPLFGKMALSYKYRKFRTSVNILFNGKKPLDEYGISGEDNERYATPDGTPEWYTLNWFAEYRFKGNVNIRFGVENILDHHYRPFASGISGPGRNFTATLRSFF